MFFTISEQNISDILGYAGDLIGDMMPLIVLILGLAIGVFVVRILFKLKD